MNKEIISNKSAISLIVLFIFGSSLILPTATDAGSDLWISILLAIVFTIPIFLIYSRILSLYPNKDLFDILIIVFGKWIGKFLCLLFSWFAFHLGVLVLRNFGSFIITVSFPETPMIVPMIFLGLLGVWVVKEGIEVLGRWSWIFFIFNAPAPTLVTLLLIPKMDFNNILPLFYNGSKAILKGTFSAFSFPFGEVVILTMIFFCLSNRKSSYKVFLSGLFIGGIPLAGISLVEILVLGPDLYKASYFPNHSVATKIGLGDFLQRLEILVLIAAVTGGFVKISVCLMACSNGIAKVFNLKDYRSVIFPMGLLMINFSYLIYDNVMEQIAWADEIWPYYAFLFQAILPIIVFIIAEIRKSSKIKSGRNSDE
ncbi:GerAB/ArcD/ProY family transporter [Sporosalibacterium faouarense]|uniref:GerAB/ArcD/ProY family transporter n=1 Tax=Sporosalibacterium faouarense TaxID=516123 RepID=UPI00141C6A12|nr:endospore germination permease [Sporosalibacterium faouarense]MTI46344.1 spore gernimation protein [Bacillota bacterium]